MAKKPTSINDLMDKRGPSALRKGVGPVDILAQASERLDVQASERLDVQASERLDVQASERLDVQASNTLRESESARRIKKTIYLPALLAKRLKVTSALEAREISEIVTEALDQYFKTKEESDAPVNPL